MKVDLKKIVEGIDFHGDESQSFLKITTGEVVLFTDEAIAAAESDEDLSDHAEWYREAIEQAREFINHEDDYIPLPSKYEFHEYSVMEEFILLLPIEGVETLEQRNLLPTFGCDYVPGFLYSPAVPATGFENMIVQSHLIQTGTSPRFLLDVSQALLISALKFAQAGTLFTRVMRTTSGIPRNPRMTLARCWRLVTCRVKYKAV